MRYASRFVPFALFLAVPAGIARAEKGGNGSHGGNTELSAEAEAREALHNAVLLLPNLLQLWRENPTSIADARAREIVRKVTEKTDYLGLADPEDPPFYVVARGSCRGANAKKAAGSAKVGRPDRKFCLSLTEIRRIPPLSLDEQVAPLIGHELAHQAGYGETDAQYFQNFLLAIHKRGSEYRAFYRILSTAAFHTFEIESAAREGAGPGPLCLAIGKLRALQYRLSEFDRTMKPLLPDHAGDRAADLPGSRKLEDSCEAGGSALPTAEIVATAGAIRDGLRGIMDRVLDKTAHFAGLTEIFIPVREKKGD